MNILFLHLSDIHINKAEDINIRCIQEIGTVLSPRRIEEIVDKIFIFITGDIAFSGHANQYSHFNTLLNCIITTLKEKVAPNTLIHFFLVPGNHDIDYSNYCFSRSHFENALKSDPNAEIERAIQSEAEFFKLSSAKHSIRKKSPLFYRAVVDIAGFSIEINLINSTFFSLKSDNDQGLHYLPDDTINQLESASGADMAITLMHHSHQWFSDSCKPKLERVLLEKNTMIFCGHEHFSAAQSVAYNGLRPARVFCGGSLCNCGNWNESEFFACIYNTESHLFAHYNFRWNPKVGTYQKTEIERGELEPKCSTDIPHRIESQFVDGLLNSNHFSFSNNLSDFYVFPGLRKEPVDNSSSIREIYSFQKLIDEIEQVKHIEVSGIDSSGKSALLKMIFNHFLHRKIVLFCSVDDITSNNRRRIIRSLFEELYGEAPDDYTKFEMLDKSEKVILIDDLHLIDPRRVANFLSGIEEEFGYVIYTTNNTIKLDIAERIKNSIAKDSYSCYRLLPLYKNKREELVNKIVPMKFPTYSSQDCKLLCNKILHALSLQRRFIRFTPDIIIQFIEYYSFYQLDTPQNDGSIFGKVFESSLTNAISPYVSGSITVDKALLLLGKIAFFIHINKKYPISTEEIISVISDYCIEYGGNIDAVKFITSMEKARIICRYSDSNQYKFCNNNYLAYFIASEICNTQDTGAVHNCLENACFGINSNILIFITYISNDVRLIGTILESANKAVEEWQEFSFKMHEIEHLNHIVPNEYRLCAPTESDRSADKIADEVKDRDEVDSSDIDIVNIYDYDEHDIYKLSHRLTRAISLMLTLARCLPNFEHNLKLHQKEAIVTALYQLPNKIFFAWASEVEKEKEELIDLIISMPTNEYTRSQPSVDEARRLLQWHSLSLLLEFYHGIANYAYRENTLEFLRDLAISKMDFNEETHALELLTILDKARKTGDFYDCASDLQSTTKSPAARLALAKIVYHHLLKGNVSPAMSLKLEHEFLPGIDHGKLLLQQKTQSKKE